MLHILLLTFYYVVLAATMLFACFYVWVLLEITLHELAHILVGKLVGFRPYALTIGKGRRVFQGKVGGMAVTLHLIPFGGMTFAERPPDTGLWWRGALFSLAGLMSDGLLLVGLLQLRDHSHFEDMNGGFVKFLCGLLFPLAAYQGIVIACNLFPYHSKRCGLVIPTDGLQFFGYISGRTQKALEKMTEWYLENIRRYDPQFALESSWFMRSNRGSFAIFAAVEMDRAKGAYEVVAEKYLNLLNDPTMTTGERAMFLDALAGIGLISSELSFRERSIQWAMEAHQLFPNCVTLCGTYGAALVESGEYQRGIDVLTPLTTEGNAVNDIEISSCYLAKAHALLGNAETARAWLKRGNESGAFMALSSRVEREIAEATASALTA